MKTKYSKFIKAGLATLLITPAFAIEGPADDSPPPPEVKQASPALMPERRIQERIVPPPRVKQEPSALPEFILPPDDKPAAPAKEIVKTETAFLGVVSGEVPQFLADHLDLEKGEGIIVRSMAPDSPAVKAGISISDVITAVAGHPVGSQAEISNQITAHKPGESVSLDVIHKGKPVKIDVTLGVKPDNIALAEPPTIEQMDLENLPKEMADHIRDAIGGLDLKLGGDPNAVPPQMEEAIRELHKRMMNNKPLLDDPAQPSSPAAKIQSQSSATFRMNDNDGSLEVKSKDGAKEVTVRDQQENVVWSGPWNNDKDRAAAPDSVRKRMENLHLDTNSTGPGLRFQFSNKQSGPAEADH
ncbi:MAG: PDZ domain-containing protein [Luteolibacter sp.]|uniref:S1C family serine protease n=1 Tax=Luteolibacter sp. TaxID=1962973 RepID=UPI0032660E82